MPYQQHASTTGPRHPGHGIATIVIAAIALILIAAAAAAMADSRSCERYDSCTVATLMQVGTPE